MADRLRVALVYPQVLGTYGDGGNAEVLVARAAARSVDVELVIVDAGDAVPDSCDIYVLGGSEDGPQPRIARRLRADGGLARAVDAGAAVIAVCGGLQMLGESLPGPDGTTVDGAGLLPCTTVLPPPDRVRSVGHVAVNSPFGVLYGFENHRALTATSAPLGTMLRGDGNGVLHEGVAVDGSVSGRVIGTYLHGPVLALNPALADHLLSSIVGDLPELDDDRLDHDIQASRGRRAALLQLT